MAPPPLPAKVRSHYITLHYMILHYIPPKVRYATLLVGALALASVFAQPLGAAAVWFASSSLLWKVCAFCVMACHVSCHVWSCRSSGRCARLRVMACHVSCRQLERSTNEAAKKRRTAPPAHTRNGTRESDAVGDAEGRCRSCRGLLSVPGLACLLVRHHHTRRSPTTTTIIAGPAFRFATTTLVVLPPPTPQSQRHPRLSDGPPHTLRSFRRRVQPRAAPTTRLRGPDSATDRPRLSPPSSLPPPLLRARVRSATARHKQSNKQTNKQTKPKKRYPTWSRVVYAALPMKLWVRRRATSRDVACDVA